jgi:hypothetical protein
VAIDKDVSKTRGRLPATFKPEAAKAQEAKSDAVIAFAKQVRDWPLLERAVDQKLEDQANFVAWWQETVTPRYRPGRGGNKLVSDRKLIPQEEAQALTGITKLQVHKWRLRLKEPEKYRAALFGAAYRKAMAERGQTDQRGASGTGENESKARRAGRAVTLTGPSIASFSSNETIPNFVRYGSVAPSSQP